jgi:hypothetical protein
VTYVVDKQSSFCYTEDKKEAALMSNWALPKVNHVLRSRYRACVELYLTGAVDMVLLDSIEEQRRLL